MSEENGARFEPRRITVTLSVSEELARDIDEIPLAGLLGAEAARRVKETIAREDARG